MDYRWYDSRQDPRSREQQNAEAYEEAILQDLVEDFRLPINHRPIENVDLDNVEQASWDTQLTSSNIGFRLLQKMGWKGKGLGKDEQGASQLFKKLDIGFLEMGDYLAIGAILSATDSVCTLQVLNQDETPLLYSLVFGEGVVNDATSMRLHLVFAENELPSRAVRENLSKQLGLESEKEEFEEYAEKAKTLPESTTNESKLILYGLYNQANVGPVKANPFH